MHFLNSLLIVDRPVQVRVGLGPLAVQVDGREGAAVVSADLADPPQFIAAFQLVWVYRYFSYRYTGT